MRKLHGGGRVEPQLRKTEGEATGFVQEGRWGRPVAERLQAAAAISGLQQGQLLRQQQQTRLACRRYTRKRCSAQASALAVTEREH
ncbi:hypothetical protein Emag_000521 [Eimeria magna]